METLFVEGKDLFTVLREAKQRKLIWEAEIQEKMGKMLEQRKEYMARFNAFCEANGL